MIINAFAYTYDKVGNRKSKTTIVYTANYTYDVLNRLTQAVNPLPTNPLETFNYDRLGNRASSNQNGASIFNTANQFWKTPTSPYQYDNNGNTIRKMAKLVGAITLFEYDAENTLVRVVSPTNTANYRYDGLGRRVEKEVIAGITTTTKYVYDNEDILLELDGANAIVARYTHGPGIDEPLIMEKNTQSFYYHEDGLGSISEFMNQSGTVAHATPIRPSARSNHSSTPILSRRIRLLRGSLIRKVVYIISVIDLTIRQLGDLLAKIPKALVLVSIFMVMWVEIRLGALIRTDLTG